MKSLNWLKKNKHISVGTKRKSKKIKKPKTLVVKSINKKKKIKKIK